MKANINMDLIYDLARLARKYTPEDWGDLLRLLNDDESRRQVINLLQEIREVSSTNRKRSSKLHKITRIPDLLKDVRAKDPEKGIILSEFWKRLRNHELLVKVSNIRMFANTIGLQDITATKRDQAIGELMRQLIALPTDKIEDALTKTTVEPRDFSEEYERWVSLILSHKRDSKER